MCVLSTLCGNVDKQIPFDIYRYIYTYTQMFVSYPCKDTCSVSDSRNLRPGIIINNYSMLYM